MNNKPCIDCNTNMSETIIDKFGKVYFRKKCYLCRYKQTKIAREKRKEENIKNLSKLTVKICQDCKTELSISNFNKRLISKDGYSDYCKVCYKKRRISKSSDITITQQTKSCIKCNNIKPVSDFKSTKKSKDGYYHNCKACLPEIKWNKEKQKLSEKKYVENNKEKLREKWRKDGKKINRIVRDRLNHRIRDALLNCGQQKNNKTSSFIGCNISYLKKWFEFQFINNMNWDTIHLWHIDHVNPCNAYNLSNIDEQMNCFNWTNLRPCWIHDNLSKSGKIDTGLIEAQKNKVKQFIQSTTKLS